MSAKVCIDCIEMRIRSKPDISNSRGRDGNPLTLRMRGGSGFALSGKILSEAPWCGFVTFIDMGYFPFAFLVDGSVREKYIYIVNHGADECNHQTTTGAFPGS